MRENALGFIYKRGGIRLSDLFLDNADQFQRKHVMTKKIPLLIIFFLLFSSGQVFAAFRCGPNLILVGDDKAEVLLKCGEPSFSELTSLQSGRLYGGDLSYDRGPGRSTFFVEKWYFNCGPHKFIKILTFRNGIVRHIATGDYGSGESDCRGAKNRMENSEYPPGDNEQTDSSYLNNQKFGEITVFGYPHSATIYLDNKFVGEMPFTIEYVEPGLHNVKIIKDEYIDWTKPVMVEPGKTVYLEVYLDRDY